MSRMLLTDGSDSVSFAPRIERYEEPEDRIRAEVILLNGTLSVKEFGNKKQWSISLNNVSSADALIINTWWAGLTKLKFIADTALITSTGISFHDNDPDPDTIEIASGFSATELAAAMHITVIGSTSNNDDFVIASVTNTTITLTGAGELTNESAGDSVSIGVHYDDCLVINEEKPLQMMGGTGWDNKYEGTLLIREI